MQQWAGMHRPRAWRRRPAGGDAATLQGLRLTCAASPAGRSMGSSPAALWTLLMAWGG